MRISYADFLLQFARIVKVYGDKNYPEDRIQTIWIELRDLPLEIVRKIITDIIADQRHPPMRDTFRSAASGYKSSTVSSALQNFIGLEDCRWCDGSGLMRSRLNRDPNGMAQHKYVFSFRCSFCSAAELRRVSIKIPLWAAGFVPRFWPMYADGSLAEIEDTIPDRTPAPPDLAKAEPAPASPDQQHGIMASATAAVAHLSMPICGPSAQTEFEL